MKLPDWIHCPNMTFQNIEKGYQEYLLRIAGFTFHHGEDEGYDVGDPFLITDPNAEKEVERWIVDYLNVEDLWFAKGFSAARMVEEHRFAIDFPPTFFSFVEWVKIVKWKHAVENNWLKDPYDQEEFNETLYGWTDSLLC